MYHTNANKIIVKSLTHNILQEYIMLLIQCHAYDSTVPVVVEICTVTASVALLVHKLHFAPTLDLALDFLVEPLHK